MNTRHKYGDDLPHREGMRTPHKRAHAPARFTTRRGPSTSYAGRSVR